MRIPLRKGCIIWSLSLLLGSAAVTGAQVRECLSLSPSIQAGKDPFAAIAPRDLTLTEHEGLVRLFKSLAGDWQGTAETFFCRSVVDPSDRIHDRLTARVAAAVDYYGNLGLRVDLFSAASQSGSQETVSLFLNNRRVRIDHDTGAGDVELQSVSDHGLSFFYRRVVASGASGGSTRREYFFTLRTEEGNLCIEQTTYVQGKLSSGYMWRFKR